MITITDNQEAIYFAAISLLLVSVPSRKAAEVLADVMAEQIHDSAPDQVDALLAADELNHRIKQRLRALAEEG